MVSVPEAERVVCLLLHRAAVAAELESEEVPAWGVAESVWAEVSV